MIALTNKDGRGELAIKADIDQKKSGIVQIKWSMALMTVILLGGFGIVFSLLS